MAIDLDKLSGELEDALERARLLAEQRQQAQITPVHMLYVLLDGESALAAGLEKVGHRLRRAAGVVRHAVEQRGDEQAGAGETAGGVAGAARVD